MKKSSNNKYYLIAVLILGLTSCNTEGPGGTSSITGEVLGVDHDLAVNEITEVIVTDGAVLEHGDYWVLNSPSIAQYYYIWYDNPTWITNGDPMLAGRTGIAVTFNYSDSNLDIATNTTAAISAATTVFDIQVTNDILTITNLTAGECPDADDVTSPFSIQIDKQGKDKILSAAGPLKNEEVYIIYGSNDLQSDDVQTDPTGKFQFTGLTKGSYTLYVAGKDTINGGSIITEMDVQVTENKTVVEAGSFTVVY